MMTSDLFKEYQEYMRDMSEWFERDLPEEGETEQHTKSIKELGEKIYKAHGMDGLFFAHDVCTPQIHGMRRFVEIAFDGIGEWRA